MTDPRFTDLVASLPATIPFTGPEALERARGAPFAARLGANESGFGPSPRAVEAIRAAASQTWMYGDPEGYALRSALAAHHGVETRNIILGAGIDALLGLVVRLLVAPGDAVVTSDGTYPTFNYHVAGFGGVLHKVPYRDDHSDPAALLAQAEQTGAKLLYLCNPDNPMGSWHSARVIARMIDALPESTVLLLDEAYADTAPAGTIPPLDATHPRVIRMRTFSKLYGLAGLRVGYAIAHVDFVSMFDRVRNHFAIGRIAQAGALAALAEQDWLAGMRAQVAASRDTLSQIAADSGLRALPSATNFVTIDAGRDGDYARALVRAMADQGIFIRMPFVAPMDRCIRISTGPQDAMQIVASALPRALRSLDG
jgi:histidinol-phosphate aminotransferase